MAETDALELPVGLTEKQFLQQVARIEARLNRLANDAPKNFVAANDNIARSFKRTTDSVGRDAGRMRGNLQNVSFQLQDIFVQIAGGQGATRALALQLPQLLGGFGALGAGIGVAVAAFPTLLGLLRDTSGESVDLNKQLDELEKSFNTLAEAQRNASIPLDELIAKYGSLSEAIQKVFATQLDVSLEQTQEKASALQEALINAVDFESQQSSVAAYNEQLAAMQRALDQNIISQEEFDAAVADLEATMRPTIGVVEQYQAAVDRINNAGTLQEQVEAWAAMDDFITQNAEGLERSGVAVTELRGQVAEMAEILANAAVEAGEVAASAEAIDFNRAISGASALQGGLITLNSLARSLLANLGGAIKTAQAVKSIQDSTGDFSPNLTRFANLPEGLQTPEGVSSIVAGPLYEPPSGGGGGGRSRSGGGGGGSAREPFDHLETLKEEIQQLEREAAMLGKSNAEIATAEARWAALDAAKREGITVTAEMQAQIDAEAAQVGRLTAELERAEIAQQQFDDAIDGVADAMAGALVAGESLRDGLAQVFKQIASDILNSGIRQALTSAFGGSGGGGFLSFLGFGGDPLTNALRGAGLPARANGGPVSAGEMYWTGERGPEPFIPAVDGRILSVAQAQAALRGGRGGGSMSYSPSIVVQGDANEKTLMRMEAMLQRENDRYFSKWMAAQKQFGNRIA